MSALTNLAKIKFKANIRAKQAKVSYNKITETASIKVLSIGTTLDAESSLFNHLDISPCYEGFLKTILYHCT